MISWLFFLILNSQIINNDLSNLKEISYDFIRNPMKYKNTLLLINDSLTISINSYYVKRINIDELQQYKDYLIIENIDSLNAKILQVEPIFDETCEVMIYYELYSPKITFDFRYNISNIDSQWKLLGIIIWKD